MKGKWAKLLWRLFSCVVITLILEQILDYKFSMLSWVVFVLLTIYSFALDNDKKNEDDVFVMKRRNIVIIVILAFAALVLCMNRIRPISFEEIVPEYNSADIRCTVNSLEHGTVSMSNENFKSLFNRLEECKYYLEGKNERVYVGNIYHVEIVDESTNELIRTIILSDEAILYTDSKQYRMEGNVEEVWKCFDTE